MGKGSCGRVRQWGFCGQRGCGRERQWGFCGQRELWTSKARELPGLFMHLHCQRVLGIMGAYGDQRGNWLVG